MANQQKRLVEDDEDAPVAKRRGRPRKVPPVPPKEPNAPKRGRGRPPKDANATPLESKGRGRPSKSSSAKAPKPPHKGCAKFSDTIGVYDINCKEVEDNWPDMAGDMQMTIANLPGTQSVLIASFHLGILEGTMLLASNIDTLEQVCQCMQNRLSFQTKKSADPTLENHTVYFAWRGRDTDDSDQVHPGTHTTQTGVLKFKNDKYTSFSGVGAFPALGSECKFTGSKTDDVVAKVPEPWNDFDEEAYKKANRGRWG
jgi:hypothetical protein